MHLRPLFATLFAASALLSPLHAATEEKTAPAKPKDPAPTEKPAEAEEPAASEKSAAARKPAESTAAEPWRKVLSSELVKVQDGKMTIERYELMRTESDGESVSLQIKLSADCPENAGISRDNFVAFTIAAYMKFLDGLAESEPYSTETLEAPNGKADVEVNISMNKEGFQIQGVNTKSGEKENSTIKWPDLFPRK